jgi:hypothetical protein
MKLRLSIAVGSGNAIAFAHSGPAIHIGRDPECELCLEGEASTAVSRKHARIDMTGAGATIADTGSSNGTLLNGRLLDEAAPLRVGDRIQMGYTGATLTVLELDLGNGSPDTTVGAWPIRSLVLAGTAVTAIIVIAVIVLRKPHAADDHVQGPPPSEPANTRSGDAGTPKAPGGDTVKPPLPIAVPIKAPPSEQVKEVGSYVALDHSVSVLLQRPGQTYPWAVLRPEGRVATAQTLVSLPGYRSLIALDAGVHLTLWGNLPDFSASPPVLESMVMLNDPSPGLDVDLTLDRGRVILANRKASAGPIRVRVRFLGEAWDVELREPTSEVALELWSLPHASFGLFTKGRVRVTTARETVELDDRKRLSWTAREAGVLYRADLAELPAWWTKPPDRAAPGVQKALRSLLDWSDLLGGSNRDPAKRKTSAAPVVTTIKTQVEEIKDADNQDLGIFFLASLDEIEPLIGFLKDRENANVRGVTLFALQTWLSRGSQSADELKRILERRGDSSEKAERIVRLLHFYPPEAFNQRKTYEELVGFLDDDNLLVRDLALWHLDQLGIGGRLPREAAAIRYDPAWERAKRLPAIDQWKKLIREGRVPVPTPVTQRGAL